MPARLTLLNQWIESQLPALIPGTSGNQSAPHFVVTAVSGDASFRRYFRITSGQSRWIAMDAPPDKEDCRPFVKIAQHWRKQGIHVPEIVAQDLSQGFLLLEDLGDRLYLDELTASTAPDLYQAAFKTLVKIQRIPRQPEAPLPPYDAPLLDREMALFKDWLLKGWLQLHLSIQEEALLETAFALLREAALSQPQVTVHRDYHSRNLMITQTDSPGVIDFQDAVFGPVTYDAVSLLKDCYIVWPDADRLRWLEDFRLASRDAGCHKADADTFCQWFELMGMQRHLKAAGIFARLYLRDGKAGYLQDIPRTLRYLIQASAAQPALRSLNALLTERVEPALTDKLAKGAGTPA